MAAIGRKDFDRWTPAETDMFMEVKRFVQDGYDQIGVSRGDVGRLTEVWNKKVEEGRAKRRRSNGD